MLLGCLQVEDITLLVREISTAVIILEHLWLVKNSTIVSWSTGDVLKWGPLYLMCCFPSVPPSKPSVLEVNYIPIEGPIEQKSVEAPFCIPVGSTFAPLLPPNYHLTDNGAALLICFPLNQCLQKIFINCYSRTEVHGRVPFGI